MKFKIRRLNEDIETPENCTYLRDYNDNAYFISTNPSLTKLNPRVPDNFFTRTA